MNPRRNGSVVVLQSIGGTLLLALSMTLSLHGAENSADLAVGALTSVFESGSTKWRSERMRFAAPRHVNNEMGKGYEFNCDFSLADPKYPRCYWDAELNSPVDLSKTASIAMSVQFADVASVKSICLYLKSSGKWYLSKYHSALGEGMNLVVFQVADYRREGTANPCEPESLNKVDEIRVNVFPARELKSKPTLATITGVHVSQTKIDSYASLPLFQPPEADRNLKRADRRDTTGCLLESRVILDMKGQFLKEGADTVIDRIKRAGFNVYVLTAWHGRGAIYRSKTTQVEPRFADYFKGTVDATADMIGKAHAAGIQVHAQFCVAYRGEPDPHPEFPVEGTPMAGGYLHCYDLQDPAYRDFIVKEIVEFASTYDVDGIQLDYIRTLGISFSKIARELYEKKYGTDRAILTADPLPGALESVFESGGTAWTSQGCDFAPPRFVSDEMGKGYEFNCDFSLADPEYPRCYWDVKLGNPVDLSKAGWIAMDVRFTNVASARSLCLYLKSNGKWHLSRYHDALGEGMNSIVFQTTNYRVDGTANPCKPESLNHVDEIRLGIFPENALQTKPTLVTVTGVHVRRTALDELKGDMSPEVEARLLEWQEEAVSDIVKRVSEGVRAAKPKVIITVDGHPLPKPQLQRQGRNEWIWLEEKWIDIAYNMDYGWRPDFRKFEDTAKSTACPQKFAPMLGLYDREGRKSFPRNAEQVAHLVDYSLRKYPGCGVALFDYSYLSDEQVKALRDGPFKEDAVPWWPERQAEK